MRYIKPIIVITCGLAFLLLLPSKGNAQEFVYEPKNPAFGGNPMNYSWLLNSANTQNKFREVPDYGFNDDPMANFHENLQRQVLSELTQSIIRSKLGEDFDFSQENTLEFGDFTIDVIPSGDGVSLRIFDYITGEETSITIPDVNG